MSKECNFKAVSADEHRDEFIRDSFISGLISSQIRQRLLENNTPTLENALDSARVLEMAQFHFHLDRSMLLLLLTETKTNLKNLQKIQIRQQRLLLLPNATFLDMIITFVVRVQLKIPTVMHVARKVILQKSANPEETQ